MKIDLQKDQAGLRRAIKKRIRDYPVYINLGPGEDEDPVKQITLGFYAEQTGYVALVFDTRPKADVDGEWTLHIENETNVIPFPKWYDAYMAICDDKPVTITKHDGSVRKVVENDIDDEELNAIFGEMLTETMCELRDDGTLAKPPLAAGAFMGVEEFDGRYGWPPTYETRKTEGAIVK